MNIEPDAILEAALRLPEKEQINLVARLLESLPIATTTASAEDPQLIAELDRRFNDGSSTVPWTDVEESR